MKGYHETRFPYSPRREILWKTLCRCYFQKYVRETDCVLELGAGYAHFINNICCAKRIAVDKWEGMLNFVNPDIDAHVCDVQDLSVVADDSIDFVFASNLFEHLTQEEFVTVLRQIRLKLRANGTLNILQPNYRFAYREYFDDYTHKAVYSDRSITDFLLAQGFLVFDCRPRFLPLSIKSRFPVSPLLIQLYLRMPFKPMGKQMLVRAKPIQ